MTLDATINNYLLKFRIMPTLKGYKYLRECIKLVLYDDSFLSFKKHVYPCVAGMYDASPESVERGISNAIESAWLNGDIEVLNEDFGPTIMESRGKPTNKEFVCFAAVRIKQAQLR